MLEPREASTPLYSTFGDDPTLGELVEYFVQEIPAKIQLFLEYAEAGKWQEMSRLAHQLRGASGSFGFHQVTPYATGEVPLSFWLMSAVDFWTQPLVTAWDCAEEFPFFSDEERLLVANFLASCTEYCHDSLTYQKWRLDWTLTGYGWKTPRNIMVVPHGARPDKRWAPEDIPALRAELGLDRIPYLSDHLVGMIGWIQSNKRWDILLSMWEEIHAEIKERCGLDWDLLAAGTMRDPHHRADYERWRSETLCLEKKGIAHYYEFVPRGDIYYKMMAVCDFIVLPTIDETQSGTLARIIALNKPYITTAPLEGLTAQTLESEGGLLFTTKKMLRDKVIRLACDEGLRFELGSNLHRYLEQVAAWPVVVRQYEEAYRLARHAKKTGVPVTLELEF